MKEENVYTFQVDNNIPRPAANLFYCLENNLWTQEMPSESILFFLTQSRNIKMNLTVTTNTWYMKTEFEVYRDRTHFILKAYFDGKFR